jgi:hypothetical protein
VKRLGYAAIQSFAFPRVPALVAAGVLRMRNPVASYPRDRIANTLFEQ